MEVTVPMRTRSNTRVYIFHAMLSHTLTLVYTSLSS